MSAKVYKTSAKGGRRMMAAPRWGTTRRTESVRLEISGHMLTVGEDLLCVLEKHVAADDVGWLRVFVLEKLGEAAEFMISLVLKEMESLFRTAAAAAAAAAAPGRGVGVKAKKETTKKVTKETKKKPMKGPRKSKTGGEQQKTSSGLAQEKAQPGEPVTGTSQDDDVEDCGMDQLPSSESDAEDAVDWADTMEGQEAVNSLKSRGVDSDAEGGDGLKTKRRKSLPCSQCGKMFSGEQSLKVHTMIHTGEKPFTCTVCGKGFKQKSHLKGHLKTKGCRDPEAVETSTTSPSEAKVYVCTFCGKSFAGNSDLVRHTMIHTGEKPFLCTFCGKMFNKKIDLERHTMVHTGEKPYTCGVCGKGFIRTIQLKIHEMVHSGERPFTCSVCGKGFCKLNNLNKHMMVHTGEKPVNCSICGKGFSRVDNLKAHMKTHAARSEKTVKF